MPRSFAAALLLALSGFACAESQLELSGQACASDADCDPGDSCSGGSCGADLVASAFSVTPAAATQAATIGVAPAPVAFALTDSTKTGHPFAVACSGGAVPTPASGAVKDTKGASISLQAPAAAAAGATTYSCEVTSTKAASARASFTLKVTSHKPADFNPAAFPSALSLAPGESGTSSIVVAGSNGFAGQVALSVSGLPPGASASLSPQSVAAGSSATLTIAAGSAAAGSYSLRVTGQGGAISHWTGIALTIGAGGAADFAVSVNPSSLSVAQGGAATSSVQLSGSGGFNAPVTLAAQALPAGVTASFSPAAILPGATATLTLTASSAAAAGTSALILQGTSGAAQHTAALSLTVQAAGPSGAIGPQGGSVDLLDFVMTGDTRPPACDQNGSYPTALHAQIIASMSKLSPQFGLDLGDHMYVCGQNLANAQLQMGNYLQGLQQFPAYFAMTMGNHECEGGHDCSGSTTDANYTTFLAALSQVSRQAQPNYALQIGTRLGRVTLVVVADNSFAAADQQWLERTLADADANSKYTLIAKHHPVTGPRIGPQAPWQIISAHKYSLLMMAHNHDYEHSGQNVTADGRGVICGLGGANPNKTGFCRVQQAADGALHFTQFDIDGNPGDTWSVQPQ